MSSETSIPTNVFPNVTMPVAIILTGGLLFIIFAGFFSFFFWQFLLNRLFTTWNQRTSYSDLIHIPTPPENTGLDPIIIKSFPIFLYSSPTMKHYTTECSICLSEFSNEQDTVRLITVCNHLFHSDCIDLWFELHKTCPVCRCELDPSLIESRSHESFHNSVTITINHDEEPPPTPTPTIGSSKRIREVSNWRFSRSYSTGHFVVKSVDVNVKSKRRHYQTGSCVSFDELSRYDEAGWVAGSSYTSRIEV